MIRWKRMLRTMSSERFIGLRERRAVATADLHYLQDGKVAGLVVLDKSAGWMEEEIPDLLAALNDDLLPGVEQSRGTLSLMVVIGQMVENGARGDPEAVTTSAKRPRRRNGVTG